MTHLNQKTYIERVVSPYQMSHPVWSLIFLVQISLIMCRSVLQDDQYAVIKIPGMGLGLKIVRGGGASKN